MRIIREPWPRTVDEATAMQARLSASVDVSGVGLGVDVSGPSSSVGASRLGLSDSPDPRYVAGLDVAYALDSDRVAGAVVVLDADTLAVVETATVIRDVDFPYVPGLLAFRELPALFDALEQLTVEPDVLVCDGYGLAHPRRFGLACHLGVVTGKPTFGVAKTAFIGEYAEPGVRRGDTADLTDAGEVVGRVLRTQNGTKPVFVSAGHLITLAAATDLTLRFAPKYRLPETTRLADQLSRRALAEALA